MKTQRHALILRLIQRHRVHSQEQLRDLLTAEGTHQWSDFWDGEPSPASGRDALMVGHANNFRFTGKMSAYAKGLVTAWQRSRSSDEDDQLLQRFVATLGVTIQG